MRCKILVVDDEVQIGVCLRRVLKGCEVQHASTGAQALAMLTDGGRYGVIFVDVGLPDMTGAQLVESFRRLDPDQAKRIVFITGGDTDAIHRQFPQYPVIAKPFDVHGVRSVVEAGSGQRAA